VVKAFLFFILESTPCITPDIIPVTGPETEKRQQKKRPKISKKYKVEK